MAVKSLTNKYPISQGKVNRGNQITTKDLNNRDVGNDQSVLGKDFTRLSISGFTL